MLTGGSRRAVSAVLATALCAFLTASPAGAIGVTSWGHATRNPIGLVGDFDGDGEADVAIGVPKEDVGSVVDAGAVNVLYGSGGGLSSDGNQFWNQDSAGILDQSETGDQFGSAVAVGDFNGDGFSDLAVGAPFESVGPAAQAGAVNVLYGSLAVGLASTGNQLWNQDSPGVAGVAETGDNFGFALAVADLNGDGYADLAIGDPGEDVGTGAGAGAVNVLYGSAGGLSSSGNQLWQQNSPDILGAAARNDNFGYALAAADFGAGAEADLAVGAPYDDEIGGVKNAGLVNLLYGSPGGLAAAGNQLWSQDSSGVADAAEQGDDFGFALAAADMGVDPHADLAVGVPKEDVGGAADAGGVNVLYGSSSGLSSSANQFWAQGQNGLAGTAASGDQFGRALVAAELGNSAQVVAGDLAIGVPYDDEPGATDAGAVNVIYGGAAGLAETRNQLWSQATPGVQSDPEAGDQFGIALGAGEFGNGLRWDLAIGVAHEDVVQLGDEGAVNVLYGYVHHGLTTTGDQYWNQDSTGILDDPEAGDLFGAGVS